MKVFPSVGLVVFDGGKVLLVVKSNHPKAWFQLPGGQIDPDESDSSAAARELAETTSLSVNESDLTRIPGKWEAVIEKDYGTAMFPMTCFIVTKFNGQISPTRSARPEWVDITTLKNLDLNPNTAEVVASAQELIEKQAHK
jgi:8-oxo-dGTP pyrophosphatase MutT (NUDIX family)